MNFTCVQLKNLRDPGPQAFGFLTNSRAVSQELLDHVKSIFSMDRISRLGGPGHQPQFGKPTSSLGNTRCHVAMENPRGFSVATFA